MIDRPKPGAVISCDFQALFFTGISNMRSLLRTGIAIAALTLLSHAAQAAPLAGAGALASAATVSPDAQPTAVRWQYEHERYSSRRSTRSGWRSGNGVRSASSSRGGVYWGGHYWSGPGYKCK
jgi:hypothetical protein